jgi:Tol biopolymer transport system component
MRTVAGLVLALSPAAAAQGTVAVSRAPGGALGNENSSTVRASPELRYLVWHSLSSNLVAGDTNGVEDIFWRDLWAGPIVRASLGSAGQESNGDSHGATLSADGRLVAFQSFASNLVAGDTNGVADIFLRDLVAQTTVCISTGVGGVPADGPSRYPMVSRDGTAVVFESQATNLVPGDTNGRKDVFVRDLASGQTRRIDVGPAGAEADGDSGAPSFSPDGTHVVFVSYATNLVPNDTNGVLDVFVCDLATGALARASEDATGTGGDADASDAYLSGDGRLAVFRSRAGNLVAGDTNTVADVFLKDLQTGSIARVSTTSYGGQVRWDCYAPWITPDGRYVLFATLDATVVPGDTNACADVFVRDLVQGTVERASVGDSGQEGDAGSSYPIPSDDGRRIVFTSPASNLVEGDANGVQDVFVRDRLGPFETFCAGDGSLATACPCANTGGPGRGCENSGGTGGALLVASGASLPDEVLLRSSGEPASALSIFLQGDASLASGVVFGDGVRCVSGTLKRLYVEHAVAGSVEAPGAGELPVHERSAQLGDALLPGVLRGYQVYYRDPDAGFCPGATFNVSNAVRVRW